MKKKFWIISDPSGSIYISLLRELSSMCSSFSVVINPGALPSARAFGFLDSAREHLLRDVYQTEWPGGGTLAGAAHVFYFAVTDFTMNLIIKNTSSLYDWIHPDLPEDIAFYKDDDLVFLGSIAHEKIAFMLISEEEKLMISGKVPGLSFSDKFPEVELPEVELR